MIIGIDADGVLTDLAQFQMECGERYFKRKPNCENGYSIPEMFGCSKAREFLFGIKYFPYYCKEFPPREGAVETIHRLQQEGFTLYEITARKFVTMKNPIGRYSKKMFQDWLIKNDLSFADITYCSEINTGEQKYRACLEKSVDIMIDDRPEVVRYLADRGVQVLMFDAPYNQEINHPNVRRVYHWKEVYGMILDS